MSTRQIDKDPRPILLELKGFRMGIQMNVRYFVGLRIEDGDASAAVSHKNAMRRIIAADIIGIVAQADRTQRLEGESVEDADCAVSSIGNP